jgi:D-glycerate 3-kinase
MKGSDLAVRWALDAVASCDRAPLLMLSGAQGCGKSRAARMLAERDDARIATISLDDVYLTLAEREALARRVHPLFRVRGPPGTHDLGLLGDVIEALRSASPRARTRLPRFDKRADDRLPLSEQPVFEGRPDAIFLEGWLIGALADTGASTDQPVNDLEREHDPFGIWRAFQEEALATAYGPLWATSDRMAYLLAPGFAAVVRWRLEQQAELEGVAPADLSKAGQDWVDGFVRYFERITVRMLAGVRRQGQVFTLDDNRNVRSVSD